MRPPIGYIESICLVNLSLKEISLSKGRVMNFCLGQVAVHTHIYIYIYTHIFFYLISYIYTHRKKTKEKKNKKKKSVVFSIKIIFDNNLS